MCEYLYSLSVGIKYIVLHWSIELKIVHDNQVNKSPLIFKITNLAVPGSDHQKMEDIVLEIVAKKFVVVVA